MHWARLGWQIPVYQQQHRAHMAERLQLVGCMQNAVTGTGKFHRHFLSYVTTKHSTSYLLI